MPVNGRTPGRAKIEVGGNFAFHPLNDGGAKASDHDADGGHHGDGGRERSDEYRSAAKRAEKAAGSEQGGDAGAFQGRRGDFQDGAACGGNGQRTGRKGKNRGGINEKRVTANSPGPGGAARCTSQKNNDDHIARRTEAVGTIAATPG